MFVTAFLKKSLLFVMFVRLYKKSPCYLLILTNNMEAHIKKCFQRFSQSHLVRYHLNKKKKSNKSGYPDEAIKTLARCFYPSMVEFFNSEEGQREYEEWLKEQEALQALPVAA